MMKAVCRVLVNLAVLGCGVMVGANLYAMSPNATPYGSWVEVCWFLLIAAVNIFVGCVFLRDERA